MAQPSVQEDVYEEYTITGYGEVLVRTVTETVVTRSDGSTQKLPPMYHRRVISPDDDVASEAQSVKDIVASARDAGRLARWTAKKARENPVDAGEA